jgi:hypothetical protein
MLGRLFPKRYVATITATTTTFTTFNFHTPFPDHYSFGYYNGELRKWILYKMEI